ncbi:MAG: hypothetical protein LUE29_08965 [Lachnospiraceae bacterium]|nr:hypothetical protein [Lachnospiraceae bacterium]
MKGSLDTNVLIQFEDEVMPFTFADILFLRYLFNQADEHRTLMDFRTINEASNLNWSFSSQLKKFIRRFLRGEYRKEDVEWLNDRIRGKNVKIKEKITILRNAMLIKAEKDA